MATKTFNLSWMRQYRADNNSYTGSKSPIRVGGTQSYQSYLGFPTAVRTAIKDSSTAPQLRLKIYVNNATSEWDLGRHKLSGSSEPTYTTMPWYNYLRAVQGQGTGWLTFNLTSDFMNDYKNGTYQGIVLYSGQGSSWYGEATNTGSNRAVIEVTGTWNEPPNKPTVTYPTAGVSVNNSLTVTWTSGGDPDGDGLRYQVGIKDGRSSSGYTYFPLTAIGANSRVIDTSGLAEGSYARVIVRAYDGEAYSDWYYSAFFTINHNSPPSMPSMLNPGNGFLKDRADVIRFSWQHNDDGPQAGYRIAWRTVSSTGVRGSWNYRPGSTTFVSSTNQYYDWPANTFPNSDIEWTVMTRDQKAQSSPYATYKIFKSRDATTVPTILTPTFNQVLGTTRVLVTWSSLNQQEYDLALKNSAGATVWSQVATSSLKSIEIPFDLTNNSAYTVVLRVKDSVNLIWSDYVEQPFTTAFSPPRSPVITGSEEVGEGILNIMYSTQEANITPRFLTGANEPSPQISPYLDTTIGNEAVLTGIDSVTLTGQEKGIEFRYTTEQLTIVTGQYFKLSAYFNTLGGRLFIGAYDSADTALTFSSSGEVANVSPFGFRAVGITIPANTAYIRVVINTVSNNSNTVQVTQVKLNDLSVHSATFAGKVSGSTTENPHRARANGVATTIQSPTGVWGEFGTASADRYSYNRILALDGALTYTSGWGPSTAPTISQDTFEFNLIRMFEDTFGTLPGTTNTAQKVEWLKQNVRAIRFNTWSFAYGQLGATPYGYEYKAGVWNGTAWEDTTTHTNTVIQKSTVEVLHSSLVGGEYINSSGLIHFHHFAPPSSDDSPSIVYSDYIQLEVEWYNVSNTYNGVSAYAVDVYRREYTPDGTRPWIKIANELEPQGAFIDYTPASGVAYEYKVKALATNDTSQDSPTLLNTLYFNSTLLQKTSDFGMIVPLSFVASRDTKKQIESAVRAFAGRRRPVREFGENTEVGLSIQWEVDTFAEVQAFDDMIESRETLLYRDYTGRRMFVTTDMLDVEDKEIYGFVLSADFVETDYNEDLNIQDEELI